MESKVIVLKKNQTRNEKQATFGLFLKLNGTMKGKTGDEIQLKGPIPAGVSKSIALPP